MSGSAFAVTHHAFSSGAGRTSDGNGSHASTLKSPSYTKSVSWQHYLHIDSAENEIFLKHVDPNSLQPGSYHRVIHTNKYYADVEARLADAAKANGKQGVLDELDAIRDDLLFNRLIY
ncbi:AHH domain-containing protein [Escherichia coli]